MLVAIVGTHYFEFYLENGGVGTNFFQKMLRYYVDKHRSQSDSTNKKCMQKFKSYFIDEIDKCISLETEKEVNNENSGKHRII